MALGHPITIITPQKYYFFTQPPTNPQKYSKIKKKKALRNHRNLKGNEYLGRKIRYLCLCLLKYKSEFSMKLNLCYKNIHIGAIATFYIIALLVRLISLLVVNKYPSIETDYALQVSAALAAGLGPAVGALAAMLIFKRKTEYTLLGKSAWKSIATIVVPCIVFGIISGCDLGVTCLLAFTYGLLEEFGWRGFLQYELRILPVWQYVLIITVMWFLWHLDLTQRSVLPFFLLLLFASWGIGKVVSETHSLLLCAAFHGIANFSKRDLFSDTTFTIAFICVIVFWIVMWFFVGVSPKQQGREDV